MQIYSLSNEMLQNLHRSAVQLRRFTKAAAGRRTPRRLSLGGFNNEREYLDAEIGLLYVRAIL
jgi:hypothetical protein